MVSDALDITFPDLPKIADIPRSVPVLGPYVVAIEDEGNHNVGDRVGMQTIQIFYCVRYLICLISDKNQDGAQRIISNSLCSCRKRMSPP